MLTSPPNTQPRPGARDRPACPVSCRSLPSALAGLLGLSLTGCALQGSYAAPETNAEATRLAISPHLEVSELSAPAPTWWTRLGDPVADRLVEEAMIANPGVERALAAVAEARAFARIGVAERRPSATVSSTAARERTDVSSGSRGDDRSTATAGLTLAWEMDLFGRVRNGVEAGSRRYEARLADLAASRLTLAADVADGVLASRACRHSLTAAEDDIASRRRLVELTRRRSDAGFDADVDVAQVETGLASAETTLALTRQDCQAITHAMTLLTAVDPVSIDALFSASSADPSPPAMPSALPAGVLLSSPGVVAAEREIAAAWAEIGVARAARLPRLDLGAALTGQWVRALGSTTDSLPASIGVDLNLPLFDGGRGAAGVTAADARYAGAVANMDAALRGAARDVQNALSSAASAQSRQASARRALAAAAATLSAREAQWRAGAVSQFELEEARRQHVSARNSLIVAARDVAQAWVALMRAAGPDAFSQEDLQP